MSEKYRITAHRSRDGLFLWVGDDMSDRESYGLREARDEIEEIERRVYAELPAVWMDRAERRLRREEDREDSAPRIGFVHVDRIDMADTYEMKVEIALDADAVDVCTKRTNDPNRAVGKWWKA